MTREELSAEVKEELDRLIARDRGFASVTECIVSWAYELTDKFQQPIIVVPVAVPSIGGFTTGVIAYAVPVPCTTSASTPKGGAP